PPEPSQKHPALGGCVHFCPSLCDVAGGQKDQPPGAVISERGLRAYPLLMESKASSSFLFWRASFRKTASHGRTLAADRRGVSFSACLACRAGSTGPRCCIFPGFGWRATEPGRRPVCSGALVSVSCPERKWCGCCRASPGGSCR